MITEDQKKQLVQVARLVLENPSAKDAKSAYSAAVLTESGNVYEGLSYFSDTYSLTLHGEQAALSHAACHGENRIVAMAIGSKEIKDSGKFTNPCHMCKQLLLESQQKSGIPLLIILSNEHGETKEVMLDEMISYPWPDK